MSHLHRSPLRLLCATLAAAVLLAHPAGAFARAHPCESRAQRAHLSLQVGELESWEPLNERTVLVWAPDSPRAHLLRLSRPLATLEDSPMLTLIDGDHDGTITACGRDGVMVQGSARSRIRSITYLSQKRTVELDRHHTWAAPLQAALAAKERRRAPRGRALS